MTTYAVIKTGGKQYRVEEGAKITVEHLAGEPGAKLDLDHVLLFRDTQSVELGRPTVKGVKVEAEVVAQGRGPKVVVFKKKRRKGYSRKQGHRQNLTTLKIVKIQKGS